MTYKTENRVERRLILKNIPEVWIREGHHDEFLRATTGLGPQGKNHHSILTLEQQEHSWTLSHMDGNILLFQILLVVYCPD